MCVGNFLREEPQRREPPPPPPPRRVFSQMFREFRETNRTMQGRVMVLRRIVQDPFFALMNISPASRMWMLRSLKTLVLYAESRYQANLLQKICEILSTHVTFHLGFQFFELMSREDVFSYFRYKDAPREMIEYWEELHPVVDSNGSSSA